jgi:hypothetical protein
MMGRWREMTEGGRWREMAESERRRCENSNLPSKLLSLINEWLLSEGEGVLGMHCGFDAERVLGDVFERQITIG